MDITLPPTLHVPPLILNVPIPLLFVGVKPVALKYTFEPDGIDITLLVVPETQNLLSKLNSYLLLKLTVKSTIASIYNGDSSYVTTSHPLGIPSTPTKFQVASGFLTNVPFGDTLLTQQSVVDHDGVVVNIALM